MSKYRRDMTEFGPVLDKEGSWGKCFDNLEQLLISIFETNQKVKLTTKVLVLESRIDYDQDDGLPYRYEVNVTCTIQELLRSYKSWNCAPRGGFNLKQVQSKQITWEEKWDSWKNKKEAWGPWNYIQRTRAAMAKS